jgi:protein-L-isoaspartate(D-aspartate) O-methyltransferase
LIRRLGCSTLAGISGSNDKAQSVRRICCFLLVGFWLPTGCGPVPQRSAPAMSEPDFTRERARMVADQLASAERGIRDPRVLGAMGRVPRHEFVPARLRAEAYQDRPLPIGEGQTISQPYVVAFMTERLEPQPEHRVLEIGTGSGYQAAVLAELVGEVYSIEIVEPLATRAHEVLDRLGYTNIHLRIGDGYRGWPEHAPYDAVIVTCAPDHVPTPLIEQLREGGRMIVPVGEPGDQQLVLLRKTGGTLTRQAVLAVRFVPMTGPGVEGR